MADRNEILANFQALSNIEDIAICLDILEQKGWDLTAAVNSVLPDNNHTAHSLDPPHQLQARSGVVDLTSDANGSVSHSHVVDLTRDPLHSQNRASTSNHHHPFGEGFLPPDLTPTPLHSGLGTHPPRLGTAPLPPGLGMARLPPGVGTAPLHPGMVTGRGPSPSSQAVRNENQDCCVDALEASLQTQPAPDPPITVESSSPASSTYDDACEQITNTEEEDEEEMEEDVDEDGALDSMAFDGEFPSDNPYQRAMKEPLIPESCAEPTEALQQFTGRFEQRYGGLHPLFYVGGLKEAVREATSGLGNHKPMMIYLHHDGSILSNVFCSQLLCSESIVSYLTNNYITWAWDLTRPQHRKQLLDMIAECFGPMARARVDDIHSDHLPVILIVSKIQGSVDVRNIIQGETDPDGLMTSLITAVEEHTVQMETERREERERLAREHMIAEQNAAYQESLEVDREKVKRKEEKRRQEEEDRQEKEAIRQSMASIVPGEPAAHSSDKICTLRIRLPDGSTAQRRFLATNTLQDLLNYIGSLDYPVHEYKVLRSYPRTDLSSLQPDLSLEVTGLCPQDTLFLEER